MATTTWKVDPAHSEVQIKVKHLMITTVTGYFTKYDLEVETEEEILPKQQKLTFLLMLNLLIPITNSGTHI